MYYPEKVTTTPNSLEVVASLPQICPLFSSIYPLFSRYHLDRTELQKIPTSSTLACKYIVGRVARCSVFTTNWLFFNAYDGGKNNTWCCGGILAIFDWTSGNVEMVGFMALKRSLGVLQLSS